MAVTLLIGGARSGKSTLAVDIGRRYESNGSGPVTFVATAPITDDDMRGRAERHIAERPASWRTIEEQLNVTSAIDGVPAGLIIIDCLTLWTSNMMWEGSSDLQIQERAEAGAAAAAGRTDPVVVVSNEVGLGIVPENEVARRYRDVHGFTNQTWARAAGVTLHLVAGRATKLEDPWTFLGDSI